MYKLEDGRVYSIREVEVEDASKILKYMNQIAGESDFLTYESGEIQMSLDERTKYIKNRIESDNSIFLLVELGGRVIGAGGVVGGKRSRTKHVGEFGVSIAKAYWGRGVGKTLLNTTISWAKENETLKKLNLEVYENNERAIKLYEKVGFAYEGRRLDNYCVRGKYFDSILMGLKV